MATAKEFQEFVNTYMTHTRPNHMFTGKANNPTSQTIDYSGQFGQATKTIIFKRGKAVSIDYYVNPNQAIINLKEAL